VRSCCALGTGKGRRLDGWAGRADRLDLYLDALPAQQLHALPSMLPPAPVFPEQGHRTDDEWRQQHTHPARLGGGSARSLRHSRKARRQNRSSRSVRNGDGQSVPALQWQQAPLAKPRHDLLSHIPFLSIGLKTLKTLSGQPKTGKMLRREDFCFASQ
jgi:hypothetical protein